ncbi:hypothetical protein M413DRAFT_335763 [Hebeloma cylindrosporum]|uniref:Secreted protein n=1 Tax=Hebeloma cylindrosporum TaxID=76867 RepID=A0A0C2Y5X7_HEBCY|nr:hypothetical protein M413DRAFT_335763 [Hebeloma cylindrosporum h7]
MIDHLVGRPSPSWKRAQVFLVILFWLWRIVRGNSGPPRVLWLTKVNRAITSMPTFLLTCYDSLGCPRTLHSMANHRQHLDCSVFYS